MALRILVVDDVTFVVNYTVRRLKMAGYAAFGSTSGWEALQVLRSGETVDVVVTDQYMPGMNGTDLFRQCREALGPRTPPFIMYTGAADIATDTNEIIAAKRMGFVDIVLKTPRMERLFAVLDGIVSQLQVAG